MIDAPENTREGSDIPPSASVSAARLCAPMPSRSSTAQKSWVGCQFATAALAQDAGMALTAFEDFLYGAVLVDWDALGERCGGSRIASTPVRTGAGQGRRHGPHIQSGGRTGYVDAIGANMPGGEVFYSPVEESTRGVVAFSEYPASYAGRAVENVMLRFEGGRVAEASASSNEDFLLATLDMDEGARVVGEFGIGCNPGIQRHTKNTLFDEKIEGTVHFAIGNGFPFLGGTNVSAVHWDMVKDLRPAGRSSSTVKSSSATEPG